MGSAEFHPVQLGELSRNPRLPKTVTLRAYEVYCHMYGPQPAMVDMEGRGCRGGFSFGEIIAFLYAHSFPKEEWSARVAEAFQMKMKGRAHV